MNGPDAGKTASEERQAAVTPEAAHGLAKEDEANSNTKHIMDGQALSHSCATSTPRLFPPNPSQLEKDIQTKNEKHSSSTDPNLVSWDGPQDPQNPKNWSFKRKWAATVTASSFALLAPVCSSMLAPALGLVKKDFNIPSEAETVLTMTNYNFALAIGPLFLGPLSEIYGRVPILQFSALFFLVFNSAAGWATNKGQFIAFRFISGLGGSAPLAVSGGLISDMFVAEQRGKAIGLYAAAPLLGPAIGPIAGSFIAQYSTWRWIFWSTSITSIIVQIAGIFLLQETLAPKLLRLKAQKLRKETGNKALYTEGEKKLQEACGGKAMSKTAIAMIRIRQNIFRAFGLLFTQPIVQVISLYRAYQMGIIYLLLTTYPTLFTEVYKEPLGLSGLNYISLAAGFMIGIQALLPLTDKKYIKAREKFRAKAAAAAAKSGKEAGKIKDKPEWRLPLAIPAAAITPIGLFLYGWTAWYAQKTAAKNPHGDTPTFDRYGVLPNVGAFIFAIASMVANQILNTYIIDCFPLYAASATAATFFLRNIMGGVFPLFAPYMYDALGYGWGNSLLGFVALFLGVPAPILLLIYGEKIRAAKWGGGWS